MKPLPPPPQSGVDQEDFAKELEKKSKKETDIIVPKVDYING